MPDRLFLDTNILVYSFDHSDLAKQRSARALIEKAVEARNGVISYQGVQEFLNAALRRFRVTLLPSELRAYLTRILMPMCEVYPDGRLYLEEDEGATFWFALPAAEKGAAAHNG